MNELNEFKQPIGRLLEKWRAARRPSNSLLQGQFCQLEQLDIAQHAAQLFDAIAKNNDGQSWTYLPYGPCTTFDEFENCLREIMSDNDTVLYAIVDITTRLAVGVAGYLRINPVHGVIEVGHLHYSAALQRTPAATEAMYLLMSYAFDELGYRRYEWKCHSLNQPSRDAALRLGFTFEGIFRQAAVIKNRNRDTAWFSIIDSEWPDLRVRFMKWLSPTNFDKNGNQLSRLQEIA